MLNGIVLGVAMLASSTAAAPKPEAAPAAVLPVVFTYDLRDDSVPSHAAFLLPPAAPAWLPAPKRHSKTDRIIAVVAGASLGFVVGGRIGGHLTENRDNPDDDISALRGVVIGAPIGAVLGGLTGYWLTR